MRVLLVEDDEAIALSIDVALQAAGHQVDCCATILEARAAAEQHLPDLVILDLALPDGDGVDFCRELRAAGRLLPILMLTARGTLEARVEGLGAGADDYVAKPFELPELLARVEALLRRQRWTATGDELEVGRLRVDFARHLAWRDGQPHTLSELELKLLRFLASRAPQVVPRTDLLTEVWGVSAQTRTRTVDVFIGRLRRAIEPDAARPQYLVSVRGVGYRLGTDLGR